MTGTLIIITGPTAVGKTDICLKIARKYGIPIINADSRQMFKGMEIGTAAPTPEQQREAKHYFVGNLQLADYYNAAMFEHEVVTLLPILFNEPGNQHHLSLMSGGSMMYIDAVCNGIDDIPSISPETRQLFKERLKSEGLEALCKELKDADPQYYEIVDKNNPRRVIHGLEICYQTGQTYSSFRKRIKKDRSFNIIKIGLNLPREELYSRINSRVDKMIGSGLVQEARKLYPFKEYNALNTVGYKELFACFDGKYTLEEAVERIKGNTRRYARKQLTWLKKDDSVVWFSAKNENAIMDYISQHE